MPWKPFTIPLAEQMQFYSRIAESGLGTDEVELAAMESESPNPGELVERLITVSHGDRTFQVDATHDGDWIEVAAASFEGRRR